MVRDQVKYQLLSKTFLDHPANNHHITLFYSIIMNLHFSDNFLLIRWLTLFVIHLLF